MKKGHRMRWLAAALVLVAGACWWRTRGVTDDGAAPPWREVDPDPTQRRRYDAGSEPVVGDGYGMELGQR